jgi:hypothetical protein
MKARHTSTKARFETTCKKSPSAASEAMANHSYRVHAMKAAAINVRAF